MMSGRLATDQTIRQDDVEFDRVLPELITAYRKGILVPFVGSGMSVGACPDWRSLVTSLEQAAWIAPANPPGGNPQELVRRADRAVSALRLAGDGELVQAVRRALYSKRKTAPGQTLALANIDWPLVLSSNYDDLYYSAATDRLNGAPASRPPEVPFEQVRVLGRTRSDCHSVIRSLANPAPPVLWALQGFVRRDGDTPTSSSNSYAAENQLERELVIGELDYRRVAILQEHFRRAFAQVYRGRSLLFLGFGLADQYFLNLFGEVLEHLGANHHPHYAFLEEGAGVDAQFFSTRFNVHVISYPKDNHKVVTNRLERLAADLHDARFRASLWSFSSPPRVGNPGATLKIVAGPIKHLAEDECALFSVGLGRHKNTGAVVPVLSAHSSGVHESPSESVKRLDRKTWDAHEAGTLVQISETLWVDKYGRCRVVLGCPWRDQNTRDLSLISVTLQQALSYVAEHAPNVNLMRAALLGAGRTRHFDARFPLAEMIQTYGRWARADPPRPLELCVHVVDESVSREVESGRLDVLDILNSDRVRVAVEIHGFDDEVEHRHLRGDGTDIIKALISDIPLKGKWDLAVDPPPSPGFPRCELSKAGTKTLQQLGVISGSALRLFPSDSKSD